MQRLIYLQVDRSADRWIKSRTQIGAKSEILWKSNLSVKISKNSTDEQTDSQQIWFSGTLYCGGMVLHTVSSTIGLVIFLRFVLPILG